MRVASLSLLLASLGLLAACGSDDSAADSFMGSFAGSGASGSAGKNQGKGGGAGSGGSSAAGAAGGSQGGAGGGGGTTVDAPAASAECKACMRAVCVNCPEGAPHCEPCSDGAKCEEARSCICDEQCAAACGKSEFCTKPAGGTGGDGGGGGGGEFAGGQGGAASGTAGSGGNDAGGSAGCIGCAGGAGSGGAGVPPPEDCGNGQDDDLDGKVDCEAEACASACADPCAEPTEVKLDASQPSLTLPGSWKGHADAFTASCSAQAKTGPDLAYRLKNGGDKPAYFTVRLKADTDATLSLRKQCGDNDPDVLCRNQVGPGGTEELSAKVDPGQEWVVVAGAAAAQPDGVFELQVTSQTSSCGDGVVTPDEECDGTVGCEGCKVVACDSATPVADGDQGVVVGGIEGGTSALQPSCSKLGSATAERVYSVRAARTGRMLVVLRPDAGDDLTLSVRTSCQATGAELACVDTSPAGGLERLSVPVVEGQVIYVVVDGYDAQQQKDFELFARSYPVECGDGLVGPTEQCDGGDCGGDCTHPLPTDGAQEQEPNNVASLATKADSAQVGQIAPPGDVDWYRVTAAKAGTLEASIEGVSGGCSLDKLDAATIEGRLDSELALVRLDGTLLASNDNSPGQGFCSRLSVPVEAGAYLLRVRASAVASPDQVFSYRLSVTSP